MKPPRSCHPPAAHRRAPATAAATLLVPLVVPLLVPLLAIACSSDRNELALPPGPSPVPVEAAAPRAAPPPEPAPLKETTVVIEDGEGSDEQSLVEASRQAKRDRASASPPVAVINNDNLSEYAAQGRVTTAAPDPRPSDGADLDQRPTADGELSEEYWRSGARELRQQWSEAADEVTTLEQRAESLRNRFYSEDDIYLRDTRIKPAWDRILDRLERARSEVDLTRTELEAFVEDGRRSGALPGWLREGVELEPRTPAPDTSLPELEAGEPDMADDPPREDRR